jgi:hypothetical protein
MPGVFLLRLTIDDFTAVGVRDLMSELSAAAIFRERDPGPRGHFVLVTRPLFLI